MDKAAIINDVERTLAERLPEAELVDIEVVAGRGTRVLRVFVDHPQGVDHELCSQVSGLLSRYLEEYTVEVSSPGIERRLRTQKHFGEAVGKKINLKTYSPVQGQKNFTGFLLSVDSAVLRIGIDNREVELPLEMVASAKLVFEFESSDKPVCSRGKRGRKR